MIVAAGVAGARGLQSGDLENGGRLEVAEHTSVRKGMVLALLLNCTRQIGTIVDSSRPAIVSLAIRLVLRYMCWLQGKEEPQ